MENSRRNRKYLDPIKSIDHRNCFVWLSS